MNGTISHPSKSSLERIVIGVACRDELVRTREVLHGLEILGDGSKGRVKYRFLNAISPFHMTCSGKEIADRRAGNLT